MGREASRALAIRRGATGAGYLASGMSEGATITVLKSTAGLDGLGRWTVMTFSGHARCRISTGRDATGAANLMLVVGEAAGRSLLQAAAGLNSLCGR